MKVIILMIMSLLLTQACGNEGENCHKTIVFKNATPRALYVVPSSLYPETLISAGILDPVPNSNRTKILPGENNIRALGLKGRDCMESAFKYSIPSDTLMVYVFDAQVLEVAPWDTVKANNLILKRYDLSLEDVKSLNWTITYPPTEAMKHIKMYPPYEE